MWIWILLIFIIGGAILGALSDDGDGKGCLVGALAGLFEGGSCLFQLFLLFLAILFACWIFG